ncbi:HAD family hydrolase [Cellulomonas flavigena]|uniref:HAD family hydrolase n=1 Tax=Cellulomonas flavigena TaxID=1711 RepID=UPI00019E2703|nr:HAD hydrolase family protein [Cellulomonas flavigena]
MSATGSGVLATLTDDVRLVASDLDGTLLAPDGTVSGRTAAALADAEDAGLDVVFVTARPHRWLEDLAVHVAGHGVAICANGASVVDVAGLRVLEEHGMEAARVAEVVARLRAAWGEVHVAVESAQGLALEHGFASDHPRPPPERRAPRASRTCCRRPRSSSSCVLPAVRRTPTCSSPRRSRWWATSRS